MMREFIYFYKTIFLFYKSMMDSTLVSVVFGSAIYIVEKYFFSDWDYARFLVSAIVIDTILGIYKNFKLATLDWGAFDRFFAKIVAYCSALAAVHILSEFTIKNENQGVFDWLTIIVYTSVMVLEARSIFKHINQIYPNQLVQAIIDFFDSILKKQQEKLKNNG